MRGVLAYIRTSPPLTVRPPTGSGGSLSLPLVIAPNDNGPPRHGGYNDAADRAELGKVRCSQGGAEMLKKCGEN